MKQLRLQAEKLPLGMKFWAMRMVEVPGLPRQPVLAEVNRRYTSIRETWCEFLIRLRETGWPPLKEEADLTFFSNCPPAGVITKDRTRCCHRPLICPFCWARDYVLKNFERFERCLWSEKPLLDPDSTWLIEFERRFDPRRLLPDNVGSVLDDHLFDTALSTAFSWLYPLRYREIETIGKARYYGGFVLNRIEYAKNGWPEWVRSGLMMVPVDTVIDWTRASAGYVATTTVIEKITKGKLAEAFARVCRSPVSGWIERAPIESVRFYLDFMARTRMLEPYGALRGCHEIDFENERTDHE